MYKTLNVSNVWDFLNIKCSIGVARAVTLAVNIYCLLFDTLNAINKRIKREFWGNIYIISIKEIDNFLKIRKGLNYIKEVSNNYNFA